MVITQFSQGGETKKNINTSSEKTTEKGTKTETKGGGQPAVIAGGKWVLGKGFTVAEHPNFRKNTSKEKVPTLVLDLTIRWRKSRWSQCK